MMGDSVIIAKDSPLVDSHFLSYFYLFIFCPFYLLVYYFLSRGNVGLFSFITDYSLVFVVVAERS